MKELDFKEKYNEVIKRLEKENTIVLATSNKDIVSARSVSFVLYKTSIFFITSKAYNKFKQIVKNPNVALCFDNIQIKSSAIIREHPTLKENKTIILG